MENCILQCSTTFTKVLCALLTFQTRTLFSVSLASNLASQYSDFITEKNKYHHLVYIFEISLFNVLHTLVEATSEEYMRFTDYNNNY